MADKNISVLLSGLSEKITNGILSVTKKGKLLRPELTRSQKPTLEAVNTAIKYLLKKAAIILLSYLFGSSSALFTTYPFGLAFLCASSENIIYIYIGLILAALSIRSESMAFFLIYSAIIIMRCGFSKWITKDDGEQKLFCEPLSLRLITLILSSTSVSLARLISDGFLYYDLFALFACLAFSLVLFFAYYYQLKIENVSAHLYRLCTAVLIFSIVYSLKSYYILGFSAAKLAALLITLYATKKLGVLYGTLIGLFAGFGYDLAFAPIPAITGLVFGTVEAYSLFVSMICSLISGLLLGIMTDGLASFTSLLPELALTGAAFLPLCYYELLPDIAIFTDKAGTLSQSEQSAIINRERLKENTRTFEAISSSLDSLSVTIAALSDRLKRPDVLSIRSLCEGVFRKHCEKCSLAGVCYGRDYSLTCDTFGKFTEALDKKGRVDITDLPGHTENRCFNSLKIISELNLAYSSELERLIKADKCEIFAIDYKALSSLLLDASRAKDSEYEFDPDCAKRIASALKYMDVQAEGVFVYGKRRLHLDITGMRLSHIKYDTPKLRTALENVCGRRLSLPEFEIDGDRVSLCAHSERAFDITLARASEKMESSDICGDSSLSFENSDDCYYFLISDGMGSGKEAAVTSRLCVTFLSKLLSAGCPMSVVLELLNGFLRSRGGECFASIDLAELDLLSGKGCFIKSGAAPSYILRDNNLYKLQSKTLPIGILKDTDAEVINFELKENDIIVMFSDGVASCLEDSVWLTGLLCFELEEDLDKMAKKILEYAKKEVAKADDMTVALMRVTKRTDNYN
ncbi:MAG: SpoIIE family protein phosphatase [Clostridia bacterium]|nr:SpoIIE family protein phosphatase [Clostridia bacterium]